MEHCVYPYGPLINLNDDWIVLKLSVVVKVGCSGLVGGVPNSHSTKSWFFFTTFRIKATKEATFLMLVFKSPLLRPSCWSLPKVLLVKKAPS